MESTGRSLRPSVVRALFDYGHCRLAGLAAQLVLNVLWPLIFFGLRAPGWAVLDILLLWLAIVVAITQFRRVSVTAAWLLAPYLAWVTFASVLNITIWQINT